MMSDLKKKSFAFAFVVTDVYFGKKWILFALWNKRMQCKRKEQRFVLWGSILIGIYPHDKHVIKAIASSGRRYNFTSMWSLTHQSFILTASIY